MQRKDYLSVLGIVIGWPILYGILQLYVQSYLRVTLPFLSGQMLVLLRFFLVSIILIVSITATKTWLLTKISHWRIQRSDLPFVLGAISVALAFLIPDLPNSINPAQLTYLFFFTFLISVNEELVWRGLMISKLEKYGLKPAHIFSSISFGIMHFMNVLFGAAFVIVSFQVLTTTLFGLGASGLRLRTNSLIPAIVLHWLNNFLAQQAGSRVSLVTALIYSIVLAILGWWSMGGRWQQNTLNRVEQTSQ